MFEDEVKLENNRKGKQLSLVLIIYCAVSMLIPELLRSTALFFLYSLFAAYLFIKYLYINKKLTKFIFIKNIYFFVFIFICFLYIILSIFVGGWTENYLFNSSYIPRQSYFVFFFPLYIFCGVAIYSYAGESINSFIKTNKMKLVVFYFIIDISSAFFWGGVQFKEWNGYTFFLEKSIIWLFVCYTFFYSMVNNHQKHLLFAVFTFFFIAQRFLGYGHVFNAATGVVIYTYMLLFYILIVFFNSRKIFVTIFSLSMFLVLLFVLITPFYSDVFINDENTFWRLESWRSNLESVFNNYSFGAGFGTSYFPDEIGIIDEVYRYWIRDGQVGSMIDYLFVRGQHSSLVNIIFRTGFIGFVCFFMFIYSICKQTYIKIRDNEVIVLFAVFVCGFSNISVHVGLESPLFLITIGFSVGALIYSLSPYQYRNSFS